MNYDISKKLFNDIEIELSKNYYDQFNSYYNLLIDWNSKINLTAITNEDDVWLKHFVDSCTINKYIPSNSKIIDVGTGAGFPGVPLKIVRDDISLTLLDSLNKRISFLKELTNELQLDKVEFIHGRAEDIAQDKNYREQFDIATARAVANLSTLSEYCLPFVKVGGYFICMKAGNVRDEIEDAKNAIDKLGGTIEKIDSFTLPNSDIERTFILIKKIKSTPKIYPRKAGTPSKSPII